MRERDRYPFAFSLLLIFCPVCSQSKGERPRCQVGMDSTTIDKSCPCFTQTDSDRSLSRRDVVQWPDDVPFVGDHIGHKLSKTSYTGPFRSHYMQLLNMTEDHLSMIHAGGKVQTMLPKHGVRL